MLAELAKSFVFGVTVAAAVGPIALLIVSFGLREGFMPAAAAGLGAALADFAYAGIAFSLGSLTVAALAGYEPALKLVSALVLLAFGSWLAGRALRARAPGANVPQARRYGAPLLTTFALTIVNPMTVVIFVAFAAQLTTTRSAFAIGASAFALFLGSLVVQLAWAAGGSVAARFAANAAAVRAVNVVSGLAIAMFGVIGVVNLALAR